MIYIQTKREREKTFFLRHEADITLQIKYLVKMHLPHMLLRTANSLASTIPFKMQPKSFFFTIHIESFLNFLNKSTRNGSNVNIHLYWHFRKREKKTFLSSSEAPKENLSNRTLKSLVEGAREKIWIGNRMASTSINYGAHNLHTWTDTTPNSSSTASSLATVFDTWLRSNQSNTFRAMLFHHIHLLCNQKKRESFLNPFSAHTGLNPIESRDRE